MPNYMMKKCSKCGEVKPLTSFNKLSLSKDGHRPDCKDCCKKVRDKFKNENPIKYRCGIMAGGILSRTIWDIDKPQNKCYKEHNVKSEIGNTYSEISDYLYNNFYDEIKLFIDNGKIPSVDRINSSSNYSKENIRIIELYDNVVDGCKNAGKKNSKPIKVIYSNEEVIIFDSILEASKALKIKRDTIYAHLNKDTTCRKGYKFESVEE